MPAKKVPVRKRPLYVGVTGHRPNRMPERHWQRIKNDLTKVMHMIEATHPAHRIVLLSGLAEGADRLSAFVALGRGWGLRAILAFNRKRFQDDFPNSFAIGEFLALVRASQSVEEPKQGAYKRPEEGYHAVGQRLLELSDVLLAIWDGEGSRGMGGTAEVVQEARARGIPTIWVHATKPHRPKWLTFGERIGKSIAPLPGGTRLT